MSEVLRVEVAIDDVEVLSGGVASTHTGFIPGQQTQFDRFYAVQRELGCAVQRYANKEGAPTHLFHIGSDSRRGLLIYIRDIADEAGADKLDEHIGLVPRATELGRGEVDNATRSAIDVAELEPEDFPAPHWWFNKFLDADVGQAPVFVLLSLPRRPLTVFGNLGSGEIFLIDEDAAQQSEGRWNP